MSVRKGGQVIAGTPNITTGHHVGEIFWTSRLDNELNGAVDADGTVYSVEAFTGDKSVPVLLAEGKLPYVSMTEYESIVSANGSCRAWGWDNGDTFRVPTAEKMKRVLVAKKEPTDGNYDWYNLYSDGWLEQGGYIYQAGNTTGVANTTTFPKAFKNNDYSLTMFAGVGNSGWQYANGVGLGTGGAGVNARESYTTPTTFTWFNATGVTGAPIFWEAKGYAEIPTEAEYQFQNIETHRAMVQLATGVKEDATQLKEYKFNNPHFFGQSMWSDVEPNNASWLLSNAQWNSKSVYPDYYDWLVSSLGKDHIKGMIGYAFKKPNEEVRWWTAKRNPEIGDVVFGADGIRKLGVVNQVNSDGTIGFYEEAISLQQDNLVYTESENINVDGTGFDNIVWVNDYDWIINQNDETFRLPLKTKLASGSAVAGNGMTLGLTDGSGNYGLKLGVAGTNQGLGILPEAFGTGVGTSSAQGGSFILKTIGITTDPTKSGIETSSNGLKLYFYVGDVVQDASLINAGAALDYFSKLDTVHCVVETFKSGSSWYRVYDDGWVEQGGTLSLTACPQTITLLKQYQDNNYTICIGGGDPDSNAAVCSTAVYSRAVGSFSLVSGYGGTFHSCVISWMACGYGA